MAHPILVVTPDANFGKLICQSLEETQRFSIHLASGSEEAIATFGSVNYEVAFLDVDMPIQETYDLGSRLKQVLPGIRFIFISESGPQPALDELRPIGYLAKPFYLPDLLEMLDKAVSVKQKSSPRHKLPASNTTAQDRSLPWLYDVNRAAQHLTRLTLESSAQAALITNEDSLWAYAGQLPQSAAREITNVIVHYWDRQEESDLLRFVRLHSTSAEHILYATRLTGAMLLALVFDAETSFTTIRKQAIHLVHSLSVSPSDGEAENYSAGQEEDVSPNASITDILDNIQPPNPTPGSDAGMSEFTPDSERTVSFSPRTQETLYSDTSPGVPLETMHSQQADQNLNTDQTDETSVAVHETFAAKQKVLGELSETRPHKVGEARRQVALEPVSPSIYNLTYACLFIPRFAHHYLSGDLADLLANWVPETCIAFGWRLEYISVRPDYLQWIVNVPPATSPGYLMRMLREQTSEKIFIEFPGFKKENPSGDFWAPGYLIMSGSQPPSAQLIKDFIQQTRQRQGIFQPYRPN